jgi:hypothetical protein
VPELTVVLFLRLKQCHMLNVMYVYKQFYPETNIFLNNANVICEMRSILSSVSNSAGIVYVVGRPQECHLQSQTGETATHSRRRLQ